LQSLFGLPETTEELSFFKLQICGKLFPGCFLGTKMFIISLQDHLMKKVKILMYMNIAITVWLA